MTGSVPWRVTLADVTIGGAEREAILNVLDSGWLSMGPVTEQFEEAFARFTGTEEAVAVTNGTAALHLAAAALGLGPGDEVICPTLTFVASAAAIRQTGADVVLADSTSVEDFALDPAEIDRLAGPRTRAVLVLHYGGYPADMDAIRAAADRHNLLIIEDAAHALGAYLDDVHCGTIGDAGCFSFFPNKNMTTGEGGMVVFRDPEVTARAKRLRSHAMTTLTWDRHRGHASTYDVVDLGFNYRIDEIRAALGVAQVARLQELNERRAELAARYRELLADTPLRMPHLGGRGQSAHHLAPVLAASTVVRDRIRELLLAERIQTSIHYPPIHRFSFYRDERVSLPRAEDATDRLITLPLHSKLADDDVDLVVDVLLRAALAADPQSERPTSVS